MICSLYFAAYFFFYSCDAIRDVDAEAEAGSGSGGSGSGSAKNPPLPLPHSREEWREKKFFSAILRRRTNRGSINNKK